MIWHLPCERVISDRKHFKWPREGIKVLAEIQVLFRECFLDPVRSVKIKGNTVPMKRRILVVEDEEKLRRVLELQLASAGFEVEKARTAEEALKVADRADLVLTDLRLPQMDGLELLAAIRRQNSQTPVIVMTAFGTIETAVAAMKTGATDFLLKPFSLDHLMTVVGKALEMRALRDERFMDQLRCEDIASNFDCFRVFIQTILGLVNLRADLHATVLDNVRAKRALMQFVRVA